MNETQPISPIINLFNRLRQRRTNQPGAFGKVRNRPAKYDFPYTHPRYDAATELAAEPTAQETKTEIP